MSQTLDRMSTLDAEFLSFGVTADYESAPDLDVFAAGIDRALAELGQGG